MRVRLQDTLHSRSIRVLQVSTHQQLTFVINSTLGTFIFEL
jgi:hypothetical protein